jgi:hypothetical protein
MGDATVLVVLLALLTAATGYAAGRLHQWYRTGLDRDEAYRNGYDTATRSTFSLAARIIGPRRDKAAVRASATVRPSIPPAGRPSDVPFPAPAAPAGCGPDVSFPAPAPSAGSGPDVPFPVPAPHVPEQPPPAKRSSRGRHFVPDELVRAATYRLTPDRVARAKVTEPDEAPPLPKPRNS